MQQSTTRNSWVTAVWHALVKLDFISQFFTWFMELLARVVEPLASLSAIYIIIIAGVPALDNLGLYTLALALIIGSPELLVVGAFKIASHEIGSGNKKGWWLMTACFVLLILTALTVGDLFMWHWEPAVVQILMGFRCLAGITYAFTRGVVTDRQGSLVNSAQVHSTLEEIAAGILETVNQVNRQTLEEVHRVNQSTLAEVHRFTDEAHQNYQALLTAVNQVNRANQDIPTQMEMAIQTLGSQVQQALDAAIERLERGNSRRLEAVYSRLEQVTVSLEESSPRLPAVNPGQPQLTPPRRDCEPVNPAAVHNEPVNPGAVNQEEDEPGESKVNQAVGFTVNHWKVNGSLPALSLIMATVFCSKTLASRARGLAERDLGLKPAAGE